MKFIVGLLIISTHAYSFSDDEFVDLIKNQTELNSEILHQEIQKEIPNNNLSTSSLLLIKANSDLENDINYITENSILTNDPCHDKEKDKEKKKKKSVSKTKHVEKGGWEIIASVEVNSQNSTQKYNELDPPLSKNVYNDLYNQLKQANSIEELKNVIKYHTAGMSDDEYLSYLSQMTTRLPYNSTKSKFVQGEQHVDSLYSMLQEDKNQMNGTTDIDDWGGICGDIHFATVLMGETARPNKYEYFTASYVVSGSQHVYSFAVDKNNPDNIVVINYGKVQVTDQNNGIESAMVKNDTTSGGFNNIGGDIRIFKHSGSGLDNEGNATHVATVPTAIGSFLRDIAVKDHQKSYMPGYDDNFNKKVINIANTKSVTKTKTIEKDGLTEVKEKSFDIEKGVKFIHGSVSSNGTGPTDIFSIAVYRDKNQNTDGHGNVLDPKKIGKESSVSGSLSSIKQNQLNTTDELLYLRLNYYQGYHKTLIRSEKVDIQVNTGININGDMVQTNSFENEKSGDGNLQTFIGLDANLKLTDKDNISLETRAEQAIGLNEERSIYSAKNLPSNIRLTPNVLNARLQYSREISPATRLNAGINYTGTQIGAITTGFAGFDIQRGDSAGIHTVYVNYTKPTQGFNRSISSYLLPEQENVQVNYGYTKGRVNLGAYYQLQPIDMSSYFGASLKVNLSKKKTKKSMP